MDCFAELMAVPAKEYAQCVDRLPAGEVRRKLQGVLDWDEIELNRSHADDLLAALNAVLPDLDGRDASWIRTFMQCLEEMVAEPAMYLMLKTRCMKKRLVLTVGNEMMGDDAAGPLLAR